MRTHRRDDVRSGGVDDEIVVDLEPMATGEEAQCPSDVVSLPETSDGGEGGGLDGSVVEEGDVVLTVKVYAVVIHGSLHVALMGSVVGRKTLGNVGSVVRNIVVAVVDKDVVVVVVPVGVPQTRQRTRD